MFTKFLVTGAAGFIGFHQCKRLLDDGAEVIGLDNLNDYYDVSLKEARVAQLRNYPTFRFVKMDMTDGENIRRLFVDEKFDCVINLAAQPGVRYSLDHPHEYVQSNLVGFLNVLEACRHAEVKHLVFASSSSVYGANTTMPFSVEHTVDHPVSLYAATKKSNELLAHSYAHLYRLPVTGLRFFTVYGPWGRPDMALFSFTKKIFAGETIPVNNRGDMQRDFTYVDDIVEGVTRIAQKVAEPDPTWSSEQPHPASSNAPYRIFNIGNNEPVGLLDFIKVIEEAVGKKAQLDLRPMQPGDVKATYANIDALSAAAGFRPKTSLEDGIKAFVDWYRSYYLA